MFLKVMPFARNIDRHFLAVRQADASDLPQSRVRFLGVMVFTCRQTPRFCGHLSQHGDLLNVRPGGGYA